MSTVYYQWDDDHDLEVVDKETTDSWGYLTMNDNEEIIEE